MWAATDRRNYRSGRIAIETLGHNDAAKIERRPIRQDEQIGLCVNARRCNIRSCPDSSVVAEHSRKLSRLASTSPHDAAIDIGRFVADLVIGLSDRGHSSV